MNQKTCTILACIILGTSLGACSAQTSAENNTDNSAAVAESTAEVNQEETKENTASIILKDDIEITETMSSSADGEHVITADGETKSITNTEINKTGDSSDSDADFYGDNAAILAANGGTLDLSEMIITTNGKHANAVFSYGEGTVVNIKNSVIETSGSGSGGLMTTGGGTMIAENLNIHTTGNSSAAIRSDRGGGTVTVTGGSYTTDGKGSPVIYSTADITVRDAVMTSTTSQGVVVEGKNSVTLDNVDLTADNNQKNSDKSSYYQAVMVYQSMSGDASEGLANFAMSGGTLTNKNGDIFFVTNTAAEISLNDTLITNEDADGVFLRAASAGWGNDGSNGGQVTLTGVHQEINGDVLADSLSSVNLILQEESLFTGSVNAGGQEGEVYVELSGDSKWKLTGDSYITSLTCDEGAIDLNGYTLYVNGKAYDGGASEGEAIKSVVSSGAGKGSKPSETGTGGAGGPSHEGDSSETHGGKEKPSKPGN